MSGIIKNIKNKIKNSYTLQRKSNFEEIFKSKIIAKKNDETPNNKKYSIAAKNEETPRNK